MKPMKKRYATIVRNHPNERCIVAKDEDGRLSFFIRGSNNYPGNLEVGTKGTVQFIADKYHSGYGVEFFMPILPRVQRWKSMSKLEVAYRQGKLAF